VVTHELYHIFTGTRHHGNDDVAQPVYTGKDLLEDRFQFGLKELTTLRRSFTPVLRGLRLAKGVPLQSPQAGQSLYQLGSCASCHGEQGEGSSVAPALRPSGKPVEAKAFASKLIKDLGHMYRGSGSQKGTPPPLNDDDIDDIVSYLNSLEFLY
jgi:cytochrome c553